MGISASKAKHATRKRQLRHARRFAYHVKRQKQLSSAKLATNRENRDDLDYRDVRALLQAGFKPDQFPIVRPQVSIQLVDKLVVAASRHLLDLMLVNNTTPCTLQSHMSAEMFEILDIYASDPDMDHAVDAGFFVEDQVDMLLHTFEILLKDDFQVYNFDKFVLRRVWYQLNDRLDGDAASIQTNEAAQTRLESEFNNYNNLDERMRLVCNFIVANAPNSLKYMPWLCAQTFQFQRVELGQQATSAQHVDVQLADQARFATVEENKDPKPVKQAVFDAQRFVYYDPDKNQLYCKHLHGTTRLPGDVYDFAQPDSDDVSRRRVMYDPTGNNIFVRNVHFKGRRFMICDQFGVCKSTSGTFLDLRFGPSSLVVLTHWALVVMTDGQVAIYDTLYCNYVKGFAIKQTGAQITHMAASHSGCNVRACCVVWQTEHRVEAYNFLSNQVTLVCTLEPGEVIHQIATTGARKIHVMSKNGDAWAVKTFETGYRDVSWRLTDTLPARCLLPCEAVPVCTDYDLESWMDGYVPKFNMLTQKETDQQYITNVHVAHVVHIPRLDWHVFMIGEDHTSYTNETYYWSLFVEQLATSVRQQDVLHVYHECKLFKRLSGGQIVFSLSNMSSICRALDAKKLLRLHCWDTRDRQAIEWEKDVEPLIEHLTHDTIKPSLHAYVDKQRDRFDDQQAHQTYSTNMATYMQTLHQQLISVFDTISLPQDIKRHITVDKLKGVLCDAGVCSAYQQYQCALTDIYLFYLLLSNNTTYSMVYGGYMHVGAITKLLKYFAWMVGDSCLVVDMMEKPFAFNAANHRVVAQEMMRAPPSIASTSQNEGNGGGGSKVESKDEQKVKTQVESEDEKQVKSQVESEDEITGESHGGSQGESKSGSKSERKEEIESGSKSESKSKKGSKSKSQSKSKKGSKVERKRGKQSVSKPSFVATRSASKRGIDDASWTSLTSETGLFGKRTRETY